MTPRLAGAAGDAVDASSNSHSDRRRQRRDLILSLLTHYPTPSRRRRQRGAQASGSGLVRQLDLDRWRVVLYFLQELFMSAGPGPLELLGRARAPLRAALQ